MKQIENLLKQTMGLDAASIGSSLVSQTVRLRMQSHGLTKLQDYSQFLQETPAELSALVEAVVVKETWFFRDKEPFNALVRLVLNEWLPAHPVGPLRLLSVPCSTGEEPYSMAMALLDAGLPAERFQIDAVDISAHALESARRAVYRKNSFRGLRPGAYAPASGPERPTARREGQARDYREHHFQSFEDGYVLNQTVREQVRFYKGNVLEADPAPTHPLSERRGQGGIYDFIFCRNLLIYFDRPTQGKVLQKLEQLLKESGVLFVGPVELPLVLSQKSEVRSQKSDLRSPASDLPLFVSARIPMAAACRKKVDSSAPKAYGAQHPRPRQPKPSSKTPTPVGVSGFTPTTATPLRGVGSGPEAGGKQQAEPRPLLLDLASGLADAGRLAEAEQLCENHIRDHGASAQAYYLLGLVRDAQGDDAQAADLYRKALYLEPNHYETLVQMATLYQRKAEKLKSEKTEMISEFQNFRISEFQRLSKLLHRRLARVVADGGGPASRRPITTRAKQRVLAKT